MSEARFTDDCVIQNSNSRRWVWRLQRCNQNP